MIAQITRGILDRLKSAGIDIREINFKSLKDGTVNLVRPAVNITVNTSKFQKVTHNVYKNILAVSLLIVVNTPKAGVTGEGRRAEITFDIIDKIVKALMFQYLGLPLENPTWPVSLRNITPAAYAGAGYTIYQLIITCSYNFKRDDSVDDLGVLNSLLAQYYIEPRGDTGSQGITGPELEDVIGLTGWSGVTGVQSYY